MHDTTMKNRAVNFSPNICTYLPYCTRFNTPSALYIRSDYFVKWKNNLPIVSLIVKGIQIFLLLHTNLDHIRQRPPWLLLVLACHMTSTLFFFNLHPSLTRSDDILVGVRWITLSNLGTSKAFISLPYNKLPPGKRNTNRNEEYIYIYIYIYIFGGDLRGDEVLYDSVTTYCMLQGMMGWLMKCKWFGRKWSSSNGAIDLFFFVYSDYQKTRLNGASLGQNSYSLIQVHSVIATPKISGDFVWGHPFAKVAKSDYKLRHAYLSVLPSARNNSAPLEGFSKNFIFVYFSKNQLGLFKILSNLSRIMSNLREFMYVYDCHLTSLT